MESYSKNLSRKRFLFVVLLLGILALFSFIAFVSNSRSNNLKKNINVLGQVKETYHKIDTSISILYQAENHSRLYTVTYDTAYLRAYIQELNVVSVLLDSIKREDDERYNKAKGNEYYNFSTLINEKKNKNNKFIHLKQLTDSLLALSARRKEPKPVKKLVLPYPIRSIQKTVRIDTIKIEQKQNKKKRLFGRLVDAVSGKDNQVELSQKASSSESTENKEEVKTPEFKYQANVVAIDRYYKNLLNSKKAMNEAENELLLLNDKLFKELREALSTFRLSSERFMEAQRHELRTSALLDLRKLDGLSIASILMVGILTIIIAFNIWKIFKSDQQILQFSHQIKEQTKAKESFLANISHEIRTPLNSIIGFSEQITLSSLTGQQKMQFEAIQTASKILLNIVNDLLDLSKFESGSMVLKKQPFSPVEIINEVVTVLKVQANSKNLSIIIKDNGESVGLLGDSFRLKQVIMNLVSNSIKFTKSTGIITISSDVIRKENQKVIWKLAVSDTGVGIPADYLSRIFDEFTQVEATQSRENKTLGTGLGLAICKRIVEAHHGTIKVDSVINEGSTFSIEIPTDISPIFTVAPTSSNTGEITELLAGKRVLIVDDNSMNLLLISSLLRKRAVQFDEAMDGECALDLIKKNSYSLLITDLQMPKMNGIELTQAVRLLSDHDKASIPILGFTAHVSKEDELKLKEIGMSDLLIKPFTEKEFKQIVSKVMV
ncbi:MAG: ATP-binding protein [Siphonobacter sp.]